MTWPAFLRRWLDRNDPAEVVLLGNPGRLLMRDADFIIGNNRTRTVVNGSPTSVTVFVGDAEATLGRGGELTACGDEILALRGPATVVPHKRALA